MHNAEAHLTASIAPVEGIVIAVNRGIGREGHRTCRTEEFECHGGAAARQVLR